MVNLYLYKWIGVNELSQYEKLHKFVCVYLKIGTHI